MHPIDLVARHAGRPLLLTPEGAEALARRVLAFDANAVRRPRAWLDNPLQALSRLKLGKARAYDPEHDGEDDVVDAGPRVARPHGYAPTWMQSEAQAEGLGWTLYEGVACVEVTGPLMARGFEMCGAMFWGYDLLAATLREACADDRVGGVFLRVESPGGVVAGGLEALTAKIRASREAAGGKPIWVYADMAASAAYWIASAADRIVAPPVGIVGSIGVVLVHEDWSGAYAQAGVKVTPIQFGAKKTDGADFAPLSESAKADLQAEVDEIGARFARDVARGRAHLAPDALVAFEAATFLALHADARRSGLSLGLVDAIATEEAAFRELVAHVAARASKPRTAAPVAPVAAAPRSDGAKQKESPMAKHQAKGRVFAGPEEDAQTVQEIKDICDNGDLSDADKLTLIKGKLDVESPAEEAAEEMPAEDPAAAAEGEDQQPEDEKVAPATGKAEGEPPPPDDKEEPKDPAAKAAAILALPEAKGREPLAAALAGQAFHGKQTVASARALLVAAPKPAAASKLGAAGGAPNPNLGTGAAATRPQSEDDKAAAFIMESHALATGAKPAAR